jgi:hypothetical protein
MMGGGGRAELVVPLQEGVGASWTGGTLTGGGRGVVDWWCPCRSREGHGELVVLLWEWGGAC